MTENKFIRVANFTDCLSVCVVKDPFNYQHESARYLGFFFDAEDKGALFFKALNVFDPAVAVNGQILVDDYNNGKWDELTAQSTASLQEATKEYPLIRRFEAEYEGVIILTSEIENLRVECESIRSKTKDDHALASINKLLTACDEAAKDSAGLYFASD